MLLSESIVGRFKNNILTEAIHLPHGTKSARVVTHVDLDGLVSAVLLVNQLAKQGIPKERIDIQFAQYGDDEKRPRKGVDAFKPRGKGEWVGVVDYAKYPKSNPWKTFGKATEFEVNKRDFVSFINSRDWSKQSETEFTNLFKKMFHPKENKFLKKNIEELYDAFQAYSKWGKKNEPLTIDNVEDYSLQLVKPDFGSDHHSNEDGALSPAQRGDLAAKSPSEAEFFADKYAPALMAKSDLKAVSMVDSAGYTEDEMKNTLFLEKNFTGPDKKRNLATIISVVYDNLVKRDEKVAKWIILNAQPTLVSLYNTTLKGIKLNGERLRLMEALRKGDMKSGAEIAAALPKILNKKWYDVDGPTYKDRNGTPIKGTTSIEQFREKNKKDLANALSGRKSKKDEEILANIKGKRDAESKKIRDEIKLKAGKMSQEGYFTIFDGTDKKTQYGRYMGALYAVNGKRQPYMMRYWTGMFQISLNTIYKRACVEAGYPEDKLVDFSVVNRHVLDDVCAYLREQGVSDKSIEKARKFMEEKNGGHKNGIWTFSGFDKIKPAKSELGDTYYDDKDKAYRAANIEARRTGSKPVGMDKVIAAAKNYIKDTAERLEAVENTVVAKYNEIRKNATKVAMNSAIKWTTKLYPPKPEGLKGLENVDKRFEGK